MNSMSKRAVKAGIWYIICSFILKGLSFISTPLFTRILSVNDIGMYSNLASWITILGSIITLDLYSSVNLAHFYYDEKIYKYMSSIVIFGSIISITLYLVAICFSDWIIGLLGITEHMLHVMFIYFIVHPAVSILHAKYRIYLQYKQTIITSLIPSAMSILVALLFVITADEYKLQARIDGYYGIWILFASIIYIYILYKGKSFKFEYIKFALPVSIPLIIHTLANAVLSTSDRIMIQKMCGSEYTAFYSIAYSCGLLVSILWSSVNQAWAPWCYEMMHQKREAIIGKVAKPILLLFSMGVVLLILIAPEILYIMGGKSYLQAVYVVPPIMLGYIAQMLYTLYVNIETYNRKQKQIMCGTLIAAVVNIVLNLCFIPVFGYVAAAYTTLVGYIVLLFVHYFFVKMMGLDTIYDMKFNLTLLFGVLVLGIGISILYKFTILRWFFVFIVLFVALILLILNKNIICNAIKQKNFVEILKALYLQEKE